MVNSLLLEKTADVLVFIEKALKLGSNLTVCETPNGMFSCALGLSDCKGVEFHTDCIDTLANMTLLAHSEGFKFSGKSPDDRLSVYEYGLVFTGY